MLFIPLPGATQRRLHKYCASPLSWAPSSLPTSAPPTTQPCSRVPLHRTLSRRHHPHLYRSARRICRWIPSPQRYADLQQYCHSVANGVSCNTKASPDLRLAPCRTNCHRQNGTRHQNFGSLSGHRPDRGVFLTMRSGSADQCEPVNSYVVPISFWFAPFLARCCLAMVLSFHCPKFA